MDLGGQSAASADSRSVDNEAALNATPLTDEERAQLTRDELVDYAAFFQIPEAERMAFNGAGPLAYAVTWRSRLSAAEVDQLNRRQREVYAELIDRGMVGRP
jgi:hypothetical protein